MRVYSKAKYLTSNSKKKEFRYITLLTLNRPCQKDTKMHGDTKFAL